MGFPPRPLRRDSGLTLSGLALQAAGGGSCPGLLVFIFLKVKHLFSDLRGGFSRYECVFLEAMALGGARVVGGSIGIC